MHGSQVTVDHVGWPYQPQGLTGAQLNLSYCVATLLLAGDVFVDEFTADCATDPARIELAHKVTVLHDPAITALGAAYRHKVRVEMRFRDGSVERETREAPRGSEHSFASADDIVGKFRKLSRGAMASAQQDALIDAVLRLETLPDSREFIALLRSSGCCDDRHDHDSNSSLPPTGIFGADLFSVITRSKSLPLRCHCPATSGVLLTFLTGWPVHFTGPTID